MQKLTLCIDIKQTLIPVYHPETNPEERKNRDLKTQLEIFGRQRPHNMEK